MTVPFMDLKKQYSSIQKEIDAAIFGVIRDTSFIQGKHVRGFEEEFAEFCQSKACASCGNGTDALFLALHALGIKEGDEVITVSHTFIATIEACTMVGAKPVLVDIDPDTMLIDPEKIKEKITSRTKAILVVHLYGQPCDMDAILKIKEQHGLLLVEDVAQAHGASWNGRRVGSFGDVACFSFYPGKNLGAYGDAGAVVSSNLELISFIRSYSNHGRKEKYTHFMQGINSRMDGLQAAVLSVKLRYLDKWNLIKRRQCDYYREKLAATEVSFSKVPIQAVPAWHLCVIRHQERALLQKHLSKLGIQTGLHYPVPCHLQEACQSLGYRSGDLPITEKVSGEILSIPIFAEMTQNQLDKVVSAVEEFSVLEFEAR